MVQTTSATADRAQLFYPEMALAPGDAVEPIAKKIVHPVVDRLAALLKGSGASTADMRKNGEAALNWCFERVNEGAQTTSKELGLLVLYSVLGGFVPKGSAPTPSSQHESPGRGQFEATVEPVLKRNNVTLDLLIRLAVDGETVEEVGVPRLNRTLELAAAILQAKNDYVVFGSLPKPEILTEEKLPKIPPTLPALPESLDIAGTCDQTPFPSSLAKVKTLAELEEATTLLHSYVGDLRLPDELRQEFRAVQALAETLVNEGGAWSNWLQSLKGEAGKNVASQLKRAKGLTIDSIVLDEVVDFGREDGLLASILGKGNDAEPISCRYNQLVSRIDSLLSKLYLKHAEIDSEESKTASSPTRRAFTITSGAILEFIEKTRQSIITNVSKLRTGARQAIATSLKDAPSAKSKRRSDVQQVPDKAPPQNTDLADQSLPRTTKFTKTVSRENGASEHDLRVALEGAMEMSHTALQLTDNRLVEGSVIFKYHLDIVRVIDLSKRLSSSFPLHTVVALHFVP